MTDGQGVRRGRLDGRPRCGRWAAVAVAGVLALTVAVAGCGGGDDEPEGAAGVGDGAGGEAQRPSDASAGGAGTGGGGSRAGRPDGGSGSSGPALTGDVEQAREGAESVDDFYDGFSAAVEAGVAATDVPAADTLEAAGDIASLASVCDLMSEQAKRQTVVYAKRSAGLADVEWTCEKATGLLLRRARQSGGLKRSLRAKIVGVNVENDRAIASVRFGGRGPISSVPLVKEDGEWKLAASPSGAGGG